QGRAGPRSHEGAAQEADVVDIVGQDRLQARFLNEVAGRRLEGDGDVGRVNDKSSWNELVRAVGQLHGRNGGVTWPVESQERRSKGGAEPGRKTGRCRGEGCDREALLKIDEVIFDP